MADSPADESRALLPYIQARKRPAKEQGLSRRPDNARRAYLLAVSLLAVGWVGYCIFLVSSRGDVSRSFRTSDLTTVNNSASSHDAVKWERCGKHLHCGRLSVPLDYSDPSVGDASIYMVKYPATVAKRHRLGTLFINPGGPGGSGSDMAHQSAADLSVLTGGRYDILGFDPRGINMSTPTLSCFPSLHLESTYLASSPLDPSPLSRHTNLTGPGYVSEATRIQEHWKSLFERCASNPDTERAMRYSSTANVVRDIVRISDVLEGEGKTINFIGISYGTLIGSYLVNMFPDRVGRVLLDGVVNPITWTNGTDSDKTSAAFRDVEMVLDLFTQYCADAGARSCALASAADGGQELNAAQIREKLMRFIDDLAEDPLPVSDWVIPTVLTSPVAARYLFQTLYRPRYWPAFASALESAMQGDGLAIITEMLPYPTASQDPSRHSFWISNLIIQCIDSFGSKPGNGTLSTPEVARRIAEAKEHDVQVTGALWSPLHVGGCWQFGGEKRGVNGRFQGPFDAPLNAPILVVGNIADPITPLHNAQLVHSMHNNSALIVHQGMGHSSFAQPSLCTAKAIRAYFSDGALPAPGLNCYPEDLPFGRPTKTSDDDFRTFMQVEEDDWLLRSLSGIGGVVGARDVGAGAI